MSAHAEGHSEEHGVHLPDPSIWPLVVGAAALALGLALLFWIRTTSDLGGPAVGAAAMFTLISAGGWAYEDGRMKRKAELGQITSGRQARFTQVVTFAISEGKLDAARATGGVLPSLEASDSNLHALAGFQDLRIILSPATAGPTQVLVETTWSNREGLATYEETRRTLLDLINAHADEVETGSVQVFDMEVLRDTKDMGFRMGKGAFASLIAVFLVGGFMIGAGLNVFAKESKGTGTAAPATAAPADAPGSISITATDNKFSKTTIDNAEAGKEFTVTFKNGGKVPHNLRFLDKKGGSDLTAGAKSQIIGGGESETLKFTVAKAGSYYYQCDVHPDQMSGTLVVK